VAAAHSLGCRDTWWVGITAFIVMQADFDTSLRRAILRIFGTLCGAAAGFAAGYELGAHPVALVALLGLVSWAGLFCALALAHGYAWVMGTVTFLMIALEAFHTRTGLQAFAWARVVDILVGSVACVIVAGLCDARLRRALRAFVTRKPGAVVKAPVPPDEPRAERRLAARHALDGAIAVLFLATFNCLTDLRSFPQAMVTAIAVLVVPLAAGASQAHGAVKERMQQRLAGCLLAGVIAVLLLPLIAKQPLWCQSMLYAGVWIGAYLQSGAPSVRYMATQFTVAFIMAMVQDHGWAVDGAMVGERLGGVAAGVGGLYLVFWSTSRFRALIGQPTPY
jgi:uncharacterized membrane protein YccC